MRIRRCGGARLHEMRQHEIAEIVERCAVAEEESFIGRHCFDDVANQRRFGRQFEPPHEAIDTVEIVTARQGRESAFDEILLVVVEAEAGIFGEEALQHIEGSNHAAPRGRIPLRRPLTVAAIRPSGRTALASPACATAPGMPQTTLEASSCAMRLPPAATIARDPARPSVPIPVRMRPSVDGP